MYHICSSNIARLHKSHIFVVWLVWFDDGAVLLDACVDFTSIVCIISVAVLLFTPPVCIFRIFSNKYISPIALL